MPGGSPGRVNLVPVLLDRFRVVRDLGRGGEGDVLLVADSAGTRWVVKQYAPGWSPREDVMRRLAEARQGHARDSWATDATRRSLLWLQEWGLDPSWDVFFEVQEYLPGDRLTDLDAWPVTDLVRALTEAVGVFHDVVGPHRDVKPSNVLVRSVGEPVLVLVDVGLARTTDASKRLSKRDGSAAYQSPGAAQRLVSRAGDWWSVGIITAQAALGFHPLALPDGSLPTDEVILHAIAERPVPHLDRIADDRVRLLCQGLLTRDSEKRWGAQQVTAWLNGESPPTAWDESTGSPDRPGAQPAAAPGRVRTVRFAGRDHASPQGLAAAFAADPDRAGELLFLAKDQTTLEDLRLMLLSHSLHEAQGIVSSYQSGAWQPTFLRLVVEMDPNLTPVLAGQSMTPDAMTVVAQQVIAVGQATDSQRETLAWVCEHDLWLIWRQLPGMSGCGELGDSVARAMTTWAAEEGLGCAGALQWDSLRWNTSSGDVDWRTGSPDTQWVELLEPSVAARFWLEARPVLLAWTLLAARDPDTTRQAALRALVSGPAQGVTPGDPGTRIRGSEEKRTREALGVTDQSWWLNFLDHGGLEYAILANVSRGLAVQAQAVLDREQAVRTSRHEAEAEDRRAGEAQTRREADERATLRRRSRHRRGAGLVAALLVVPAALGLWLLFQAFQLHSLPVSANVAIGDEGDPGDVVVSPQGSQVFVSGGQHVSEISPANATVSRSFLDGESIEALTLSPDGSRLYVVSSEDERARVHVVRAGSSEILKSVNLGSRFAWGVAVSPDGSRVYATTNQGDVAVIDTESLTVVDSIRVGSGAGGLAVSPDGSKVYVESLGKLAVIDAVGAAVVQTIPLEAGGASVVVSPDGERVYVPGMSSVIVIDAQAGRVSRTIDVGDNYGGPKALAISPDGSQLFAVGDGSNSMHVDFWVINTAEESVTQALNVGVDAFGVAVAPDGSQVYVANVSESVFLLQREENRVSILPTSGLSS